MQGAQIGIRRCRLGSAIDDLPRIQQRQLAIEEFRLSVVGSDRLPRAWRAYLRMARLSATSASARAVRDSSVPHGGSDLAA